MQNVNRHQLIKINIMDLDTHFYFPQYSCAITNVNKNSYFNGIIENDYNELCMLFVFGSYGKETC